MGAGAAGTMRKELPRERLWGRGLAELDRAADAELAHAGLESGAFDVEKNGGAFGAGDAPLGLFKGAEDVLAFSFFEGGN